MEVQNMPRTSPASAAVSGRQPNQPKRDVLRKTPLAGAPAGNSPVCQAFTWGSATPRRMPASTSRRRACGSVAKRCLNSVSSSGESVSSSQARRSSSKRCAFILDGSLVEFLLHASGERDAEAAERGLDAAHALPELRGDGGYRRIFAVALGEQLPGAWR